jgi:hypothetical protein
MKLLKGDFQPGDTIAVDAGSSSDVLTFKRAASAPGEGAEPPPGAQLH